VLCEVQLGTRRGGAMVIRSSRLEELVAVADLRVRGILDLQPRCAAGIGLVRAVRPLPDDALKVAVGRASRGPNA
jgi:hypothetical protein